MTKRGGWIIEIDLDDEGMYTKQRFPLYLKLTIPSYSQIFIFIRNNKTMLKGVKLGWFSREGGSVGCILILANRFNFNECLNTVTDPLRS